MNNLTSTINIEREAIIKKGLSFEVVNPNPSKELLEALKEADDIIANPDKYPRYSNRQDLKKSFEEL